MESHWETEFWIWMGQKRVSLTENRLDKHSQKENHWVKEWGLPKAVRTVVLYCF